MHKSEEFQKKEIVKIFGEKNPGNFYPRIGTFSQGKRKFVEG